MKLGTGGYAVAVAVAEAVAEAVAGAVAVAVAEAVAEAVAVAVAVAGAVAGAEAVAWVAGDTNETTRDILQLELLGEISYRDHRKILDGSGLVPRDKIGDPTWKQGVPNLVDQIPIDHISGGQSVLGFKSFDQGRRAFQGTAKHWIWLDEECPEDVYGECLIRTATTGGQIITTFTPMNGLTPLVLGFLQADDLFILSQREVFSKSVFDDPHDLVLAWIDSAKMHNCPASFHLTFPSRALISIAAHYKAKSIKLKEDLSTAEDSVSENSDYWIEKRKS
jgi:phage terminase large subunit-like protein